MRLQWQVSAQARPVAAATLSCERAEACWNWPAPLWSRDQAINPAPAQQTHAPSIKTQGVIDGKEDDRR